MTGQAGSNGQDRGEAVDGERRVARNAREAPGGSGGAGGSGGSGGSRGSRGPGGQRDLTDDIQRWLVRSGVRSMRREVTDQVRRAFHAHRPAEPADVWGTATTEPSPELLAASAEAPECAWCPVCRAARRIRESGSSAAGLGGQLGGLGGLSGQLAGAGDAVAAAVQEAFSAFESLLSAARPRTGDGFPADRYPADRFPTDRFPAAGTEGSAGTGGTPPRDADHEPDDRG